jgi:hypothetical protein
VVLEVSDRRSRAFGYGAITLYGCPFQVPSPSVRLVDSVADRQAHASDLTTPALQRLPPYAQVGFRLFPFRSPLLRECCLLLGVLRCFSSPGALSHSMDSSASDQASPRSGFPIRTSPDHRLLPTTRSFSQVTASFIGLWRQGIHRAPFVA